MKPPERNLTEWLGHMEALNPASIDLGLERVREVGERMEVLAPASVSVIVAGTNGKGSTCVCLERILLASGRRTGCTLSPHLESFRERVRINGVEADSATLCAAFEAVEAARGDLALTYFEYSCLATLFCFKAAAVDVAILEVGLGGRLDAFNIVDAQVAVVTSIGLDHMAYLGDSCEAIGAEKAGVFRTGQHIVLGNEMPDSVLAAAARATASPTRWGEGVAYRRRTPAPTSRLGTSKWTGDAFPACPPVPCQPRTAPWPLRQPVPWMPSWARIGSMRHAFAKAGPRPGCLAASKPSPPLDDSGWSMWPTIPWGPRSSTMKYRGVFPAAASWRCSATCTTRTAARFAKRSTAWSAIGCWLTRPGPADCRPRTCPTAAAGSNAPSRAIWVPAWRSPTRSPSHLMLFWHSVRLRWPKRRALD